MLFYILFFTYSAIVYILYFFFFFFNDTATTEIYTLSLHDALPIFTVDIVASQHYVQGTSRLGRPSVAHATAAGKVMLAFTGRRPTMRLEAYTEKTITDLEALDAELMRVR